MVFKCNWTLSYAGENFPTAIGEAVEKALVRSARKRRRL
jgi:hypothetical protein